MRKYKGVENAKFIMLHYFKNKLGMDNFPVYFESDDRLINLLQQKINISEDEFIIKHFETEQQEVVLSSKFIYTITTVEIAKIDIGEISNIYFDDLKTDIYSKKTITIELFNQTNKYVVINNSFEATKFMNILRKVMSCFDKP